MAFQPILGHYSATVDAHSLQVARVGGDPAAAPSRDVRIVHVSDTHNVAYSDVPYGDILVHSGDFCNRGKPEELAHFKGWLAQQPHPFKIVVCGNHEIGFDRWTPQQLQEQVVGGIPNAIVLQDEAVTVLGLRFYGSSWNNCGGGYAWGAPPDVRKQKWAAIPNGVDVLVTHLPAFGIFDLAWVARSGQNVCDFCRKKHENFEHWGDEALRARIHELRIPLHLTGHVHDDVGVREIQGTTFSNAAMDIKKKAVVLDVTVWDGTAPAAGGAAAAAAPTPADASGKSSRPVPSPRRALPSTNFVLHPNVARDLFQRNHEIVLRLAVRHNHSDGTTSAERSRFVLDVDAADTSQRTVLLWKRLPQFPLNQRWRVVVPTNGRGFHLVSSASPPDEPRCLCWRITEGTSTSIFMAPLQQANAEEATSESSVSGHTWEAVVPTGFEEATSPAFFLMAVGAPAPLRLAAQNHSSPLQLLPFDDANPCLFTCEDWTTVDKVE